jgi:hypothetical protein
VPPGPSPAFEDEHSADDQTATVTILKTDLPNEEDYSPSKTAPDAPKSPIEEEEHSAEPGGSGEELEGTEKRTRTYDVLRKTTGFLKILFCFPQQRVIRLVL